MLNICEMTTYSNHHEVHLEDEAQCIINRQFFSLEHAHTDEEMAILNKKNVKIHNHESYYSLPRIFTILVTMDTNEEHLRQSSSSDWSSQSQSPSQYHCAVIHTLLAHKNSFSLHVMLAASEERKKEKTDSKKFM